jgi:hypothetical protein
MYALLTYIDTGTNEPYTGGEIIGELVLPDIEEINIEETNEKYKDYWEYIPPNEYPILICTIGDNTNPDTVGIIKILTYEEMFREITRHAKNIELISDAKEEIRSKRNQLLLQSVDKIPFMFFEGLSEDQQNEIKLYRQLLLDVPQQKEFPFAVKWPKLPSLFESFKIS